MAKTHIKKQDAQRSAPFKSKEKPERVLTFELSSSEKDMKTSCQAMFRTRLYNEGMKGRSSLKQSRLSHSRTLCLSYTHANNESSQSSRTIAMDHCDTTLPHTPIGLISTRTATVLDALNTEARISQSASSSGKLHVAPSAKL